MLKAVGLGQEMTSLTPTARQNLSKVLLISGESGLWVKTHTFGRYTCLHLFTSLMSSIAPPLLSRGKSSRQGEFSMTRDHSTLSPSFGPRTPRSSTTPNFHLETRYRYRLMTSANSRLHLLILQTRIFTPFAARVQRKYRRCNLTSS